jgi:hypothetical protein
MPRRKPMATTLEKNLAFFEKKRAEWLSAGLEGKWAVVIDGALEGHFDTPRAAYEQAIAKADPGQFLIRQIRSEERPESIPAVMLGLIRGAR